MLHNTCHGAVAALLSWLLLAPAAEAGMSDSDIRGEIQCLALNIYFEARSEPIAGKVAVGHVVMNRVAAERYPDKVCEVVKQGGEKPRHKCQFSWYCDGRSDRPANRKAWKESMVLARVIYWGYSDDPTNGALWYHADYVRPVWRRALERGPKIGRHVFYAALGRQADPARAEDAARFRGGGVREIAKDEVVIRSVKTRADAKAT